MERLKGYLKKTCDMLVVVAFGVLLYELLEHFVSVRMFIKSVIGVLTPVLLGIAFAYIVNLPASIIYRSILKRNAGKKKGKANKERNERVLYTISVVIGYALVIGLLTLLFLLVIPKVIYSVKVLIANFENYYDGIVNWATDFWERLNLKEDFTNRAIEISKEILGDIENWIIAVVPTLLNYTFNVVQIIADILLAFALSIYLLIDKHRLLAHSRRLIRAILSEERAEHMLDVLAYSNKTFRGYFGGQIISSALIGIGCYIGMRILHMPFPEMISLLIAVLAMLPVLGPWLSTIPSAFIIFMASPENPMLAVWFVVLVLVIQQLDNNITYPLIVGDAVGLSSAWVMIAIIVFGGCFGFIGLLFAVPVTAVIYRIIGDWTNARAIEKGVPIVERIPNVQYERKGKLYSIIARLKTKGRSKQSKQE